MSELNGSELINDSTPSRTIFSLSFLIVVGTIFCLNMTKRYTAANASYCELIELTDFTPFVIIVDNFCKYDSLIAHGFFLINVVVKFNIVDISEALTISATKPERDSLPKYELLLEPKWLR